jgi:toxin ParE1/3/4
MSLSVGKIPLRQKTSTLLSKKADALALYPRLDPRRPDISPSTRTLIEGAYLLLYETYTNADEGPIDVIGVVRIIDGRRDLTQPF